MATESHPVLLLLTFMHRTVEGPEVFNLFVETARIAGSGSLTPLLAKRHRYDRLARTIKGTVLEKPVIGGVYEVPATEDHAIVPADARYVGMADAGDLRAEWAARDVAIQGDVAAAASLRKDTRADALRATLEPLRAAYRKSTGPQKAQLIAKIVRIITE